MSISLDHPMYASFFSYIEVDPDTWCDAGPEREFTSGSISYDCESILVNSASLSLTEKVDDGEFWLRIYIKNGSEKNALFTGLLETPKRALNGHMETYDVDCYSVLKPADDVLLPLGYTAKAGTSVYEVKKLLSVCPAPIEIDGFPPGISENIVAGSNDTNLSMAQAILSAIGWRIRISGDGTITLCPKSTSADSKIVYGTLQLDYIEPDVTDTYDWYDCPNVLRLTLNSKTVIARDDNPNSPLSTVSRGREIWRHEDDIVLSKDENLAEAAFRRLKELQTPSRTLSYKRRYYEDIVAGDVVSLHYKEYDLSGDYIIISQNITLGYDCEVSEEVKSI